MTPPIGCGHFKKKSKIGNWSLHDEVNDGLIGQRIRVRRLRCDNAGENVSFAGSDDHDGLNVEFEYTSP